MTETTRTQDTDRLHALDAVRAFALLAGIVLHATMSFFTFLPAQDTSQSTTLAVLFYVIHIFRMSVFYVIAGFFAHLVLQRKGVRTFLVERSKRIVGPMVIGWIILAPSVLIVVGWGLSKTFPQQAADGPSMPFPGLPLVHLWFLYYLCLFYAIALFARWAMNALVDRDQRLRKFADRCFAAVIRNYASPIVFGLPLIVLLFSTQEWAVWSGIPTPDYGLTPKLPAMIGFGAAFGFGWFLHRQLNLLDCLRTDWIKYLIPAVIASAVCIVIVGPTPSVIDPFVIEGGQAVRLAYAACYVVAIWCWSLAIIGAALSFLSEFSATRRYLADSSYWLYLAHLPIVFVLQILLMDVRLHWAIKFSFLLLITMAILLVSYHYLVRSTFIGKCLNGRRHSRTGVTSGSGLPKALPLT
jgi:hypothetical protein